MGHMQCMLVINNQHGYFLTGFVDEEVQNCSKQMA